MSLPPSLTAEISLPPSLTAEISLPSGPQLCGCRSQIGLSQPPLPHPHLLASAGCSHHWVSPSSSDHVASLLPRLRKEGPLPLWDSSASPAQPAENPGLAQAGSLESEGMAPGSCRPPAQGCGCGLHPGGVGPLGSSSEGIVQGGHAGECLEPDLLGAASSQRRSDFLFGGKGSPVAAGARRSEELLCRSFLAVPKSEQVTGPVSLSFPCIEWGI
ncbi:uncharacterized protein [Petaurus breviceps papuanus]|uniref:uncharacterized protein isoform X1 n=1 Tax=Petaurus breviceps papuanus TaxID=3040969 RepID=UPI0036DB1ED1